MKINEKKKIVFFIFKNTNNIYVVKTLENF